MTPRSLFLIFLTFVAGCATVPETEPVLSQASEQPTATAPASEKKAAPFLIRVAIETRQAKVHLRAPEEFVLSGFPWGTPTVEKGEKRYRETTLTSDRLYAGKAYIAPLGDGQIQVNGLNFRGSVEIVEDVKGTLTVINQLPLEDYVMGVLAGEIPGNWPLEALKAQAVAARTFALLSRMQARDRREPYDLENTALFQRYQGSDRVTPAIRKAVTETQGDILTYKNKPILAFFHSNCGGDTADAASVWTQAQPYLKSVPCTYGNNGAHYRWTAEMAVGDMVRKLRAAGLSISDIDGLEVTSRDEGKRILRLAIVDSDGSHKTMKGSSFRMALGPDVIRSTRFEARMEGQKVLFAGKGWGHGVGLCQEGACGMALKGFKAFDILRHYYHGIMVEKMDRYR